VWAPKEVSFVFKEGAACRGTGRGGGQLHAVLAGLEWEDMVHPLDQEEPVGETGLLVGDGIEAGPIDLVELGVSPVVDPAEMLYL
jgi:hypothetical protein